MKSYLYRLIYCPGVPWRYRLFDSLIDRLGRTDKRRSLIVVQIWKRGRYDSVQQIRIGEVQRIFLNEALRVSERIELERLEAFPDDGLRRLQDGQGRI